MTRQPPDQRALWSRAWEREDGTVSGPSAFFVECAAIVPSGARILELGCGEGEDAAALAALGHHVTATDFVARLIERNRLRHADDSRLEFRPMRIDEPFPFAAGAFDAVYAHLTLHYFTNAVTREIFREIRRVLRPGGLVLFACKSDHDPLYGRGVEIEPDMFELDGKVRHFFSETYARACLGGGFTLDRLDSHTGYLYGTPSAWITAIAHVGPAGLGMP